MLGTAALCLGVLALGPTSPATASTAAAATAASAADPGPVPKDGPEQPVDPAATPAAGCTLTDPAQPDNEFAMCSLVSVSAATAPSATGASTVAVTVRTQRPVKNAVLQLSASTSLSIVSAPGFGAARAGFAGFGAVSSMSRPISAAAGGSQTFYVQVKAVKGQSHVSLQAELKTGDAQTNAIGEKTWQLGSATDADGNGAVVAADTSDAAAAWADRVALKKALTPKVPAGQPASLSPNAPGASCATGGFFYVDENGVTTPAWNVTVQVWDVDSNGNDLLASAYAGGDGRYNICFESTDFDEGGGQEAYIRYVTSNPVWRVRNDATNNGDWAWATGAFNYGDPGGTHEFGNGQPGDSATFRALHAADSVNKLYQWNGQTSGIDDPGESRQMIVNWTPTSTDGTYYSLAGNDIHLDSNDPDSDHITIHEGSHALMDALYEDDYPPFPNCSPHFIFGNSSTGCAWTEGWAEWVPARVLNDPFFRFENGTGPNLETPGWNDGNPTGDQAEGRIAGALIDLSDTANEAPWDRFSEGECYGAGCEETLITARTRVSDTLDEYFNVDRPGIGDVGFAARTALFANTISYAARPQRDPLDNGAELVRPSLQAAPNPHNYSYTTPFGYWSGVGIRGTNDNDIYLYDDEAQTAQLAASTYGGTSLDYVLVDSNSGHRPVGDAYFPRAQYWSGTGAPYTVERSSDSNQTSLGATSVSFAAGDVLKVRDISLAVGATEYLRVVPTSGLDVGVHLHRATATASTWAQGRPSRVAEDYGRGAGVAEAISYTPPADTAQWGALVLTNTGGSGTATIYRDRTAPASASVTINGGDATTTSTSVNLSLAASDSETDVAEMRISTDGVLDSESWEPYSASKAVTLPAGTGTKTVIAQFRNNAGMETGQVSDTIELIAAPGAPTITSTTPGAGKVTLAFSAPADNGNSAITSYQALCTSTDGGDSGNATGAASPLVVNNLSAGKSYRCRVRATNAAGTSAYSAYGATVVLPAAAVPPAPTVTNSTPGAQKVTVAFSPNGNGGAPITSYQALCQSTDGGVSGNVTGAASPLAVTGLSAGKTYRCRVRASNTVGTGAYGAYGSDVVLPPASAPAAPTVTSSTPSAGAVNVAFTPNGDGGSPITSYQAQCTSTDGGSNGNTTGAGSPLKVTGLSAGKSYRCRVRATNAQGTSAYGAYGATVVVPADVPGKPTVTSTVPSAGAATVSFVPSTDGGSPITSYQASCVSSDGGATRSANGAASPLEVTGLTSGASYRCRVRATNALGTSAWSSYGTTVVVS